MKSSIIRYGLQNFGDKPRNQVVLGVFWLDQTFFNLAQRSDGTLTTQELEWRNDE
jgi:hypothetical protein